MTSEGTSVPALLARGRLTDALERVDAVRAAPPASARWLDDAVLSGLLGEPDRAWAAATRAVGWGALAPSAAVGFASALERPSLADPLLEDLLARGARADDLGAALGLARAEAMLGREEAARRRARQALSGGAVRSAEDLSQLERLGLFDAVRGAQVGGVDGLATRARVALWSGDAASARSLAEEALASAPDRVDLWRVRGAAEVIAGAPADGLPALDRAIAGGDREARRWRAEALRDGGDLAAAFAELERASREGTEAFALGILRANVEAAMLLARHPALPPGLAADLRNAAALERRYGVPFSELPGWCEPGRDLVDPAARLDATRRALEGLGGNRGDRLTRVAPRGLVLFDPPRSVRWQSDAALRILEKRPPEQARAALDELVRAHPSSPHPRCFRGELHLFEGDYAAAERDFAEALATEPARWAHVGAGAVRMLRGDLAGAEAAFARTEAFGPVPGATTHVYRGEGLRRAGRFAEARHELEIAARGRPSRVGAWINLALLDEGAPDLAYERVIALAPALAHLAARRIGGRVAGRDRALLDSCLALSMGNRSSRLVTVVEDDAMRVLPAPSRLSAFGATTRPRASSADDAGTLRAAMEIASALTRAPALPSSLPMLGLRLLAAQRAEDGVDLVIGRVAPLGLIRVRGPGRAEALAPPALTPRVGRALSALAARVGRATTRGRWERARRAAEALPVCEAPI